MKSGTGEMRTEPQLSVFLVNKPGVLARVCHKLAGAKINIIALSMMDSTEHGVLRIVVHDPSTAKEAIAALDLPVTETQVLVVELPNRTGALADVVERFAIGHVNVNYAYVTTGGTAGKTLGVFRVSDMQKAQQLLSDRKPRRRASPAPIKKPHTRVRR